MSRAEQAFLPGPGRRGLQRRLRGGVLGATQHEAVGCAHGVPGERHPLEQQLGAALHQVLVDVGAGVALVAVGDDELFLAHRFRRERPLGARREAGPAAAADLGRLDLGEQAVGAELGEGTPQSPPIAARGEDWLGQEARPLGLGRGAALPRERPLQRPGPGVDRVADPDRGRGVAEAEADGLGQGDRAVRAALAWSDTEPGAQALDRGLAGRGEACGPGADPHVALPTRGEQVVVEGRDAVDRCLGQPGYIGGALAVGVSQLTVVVHRLLQDLQGGGRVDGVVTADQLDQIAGHGPSDGTPNLDTRPISIGPLR